MSLSRPIPKPLLNEMLNDDFYSECCLSACNAQAGLKGEECEGRIEFHHERYAGRRISEKFSIVPVCHFHHENEKRKDIRPRLREIARKRMTEEDKEKYPLF